MKRLAFYALVIAATVAVLILFWQFRSIVILLFLSLILTATLRPTVDFLSERGVRPGLARALVYLAVFGTLVVAVALLIEPLLQELELLSNYLLVSYDSTYRSWAAETGVLQAAAARLPAPDQLDEALSGPIGMALRHVLFGVSQDTLTLIAGLVIVIALSLYWSADRGHFERLWLSLLPVKSRIQARTIWHRTEKNMGAYVRSEVVQTFLAIVLLIAGFWLVGLDYPILAGLLAGIVWLIPLVGFMMAAGLSFLFGLASVGGLVTAIAALVVTILVLAFLEYVVEPRLFQRRDFSGVLIILVMVAMVDAYGLIGFIIAPPLAVAFQVSVGNILRATRQQPDAARQLEGLKQQLAAVQVQYRQSAETGDGEAAMPPEVGSLLNRLEGLLDEAWQLSSEQLASGGATSGSWNIESTAPASGKDGG